MRMRKYQKRPRRPAKEPYIPGKETYTSNSGSMDMGGRSDAIPKYSAEDPSRTWSNVILLAATMSYCTSK